MKGFVLLWCMFLLFGCGTKKQNYRSETVSTAVSSQKDSTHVTESVQRTITELLEYKGTGIITITELSKPVELKDYRNLPNRKGYRKFYLNLAKMIYLIKYKIDQGQAPYFTVTN